ncbi:MAG: hypothetical protein ACP5QP_04870 [Brevinematia bacterium]
MVALITKYGQGLGLGHIKRMKVLKTYLTEKEIDSEIFYLENLNYHKNIKLAIIDAREVDKSLINELIKEKVPVISLDDTETEKPSIISIFSLPFLETKGPKPNFQGKEFLILDPEIQKTKKTGKEFDFLITFGGEDPNNLTELFLNKFKEVIEDKKTAILIGPLFKNREKIKKLAKELNIKVYENENIYSLIALSDTIITSFGITTYESLILGKHIILLNNSEYHHKLFLKSKLKRYGIKEIGFLKNGKLIKNKPQINNETIAKFSLNINENLERWANLIKLCLELENQINFKTLYGAKAIARTKEKTIFLKNNQTIILPLKTIFYSL